MTELLAGTRRERLRAQTLTEIKEHALAQLAEGGPEALSLNGISRAMRMSGPALYRYFASRDELLAALVVESYDELADALQRAAAASLSGSASGSTSASMSGSGSARRKDAEARFHAVADAYRSWATGNPHRYQLIFASRYGSGLHAPERTIPAADRSMRVVLDAVADLVASVPPTGPDPVGPEGVAASDGRLEGQLEGQLEAWADNWPDRPDVPPAVLHLGVLTWTRMHGLASLEIGGTFTAMHIDPDLLFTAEVDHLVAQARDNRAGPGPTSAIETEA